LRGPAAAPIPSVTITPAPDLASLWPVALSYATIAGLRGENGLYGAMVGPL